MFIIHYEGLCYLCSHCTSHSTVVRVNTEMLRRAEHVIPMNEKKSRGNALKASTKNAEELWQ